MPNLDKAVIFDKIGYKPHSQGQLSYHSSTARFRVPCCGRRYGKSTMAGADRVADLFMPGTYGWIVGPTYDLGEKEFRVIWDSLIVNLRLGLDKRVKKAYNKRMGEMYIEMPWGSRVEVRSATQPERLVGEKLHWAIMSEAAKHNRETWERFIRPALSDYRGSADFPSTPEGFNWYYDLWMHGFDDGLEAWNSWQFPSWENPVVFPEGRTDPEILEIEKTTTKEWFLQEIAADFSAFVGKIFDEFSPMVHVKRHSFNPAWRNYLFFDWGFVNPLACLEVQIDPMDNVYIWREHYGSYKRVEEHCQILRSRERPDGYHVDCAFGDAADPEAASVVSQHLVQCVAMNEAKANWREGIDLIKKFLRTYDTGRQLDEFGTPELKPKLFVDPSCVNLIREFNNYKANDSNRSNLRESSTTSAAIKEDDHCLDALRYGLMHIYKLGATYSLRDALVGGGVQQALIDQGRGDTYFREQASFVDSMEF
jgi:hypothetical protein